MNKITNILNDKKPCRSSSPPSTKPTIFKMRNFPIFELSSLIGFAITSSYMCRRSHLVKTNRQTFCVARRREYAHESCSHTPCMNVRTIEMVVCKVANRLLKITMESIWCCYMMMMMMPSECWLDTPNSEWEDFFSIFYINLLLWIWGMEDERLRGLSFDR